jgi:hypothetical protein
MLNKFKKLFVVLMIVSVVSFSLTGCEKKAQEKPDGDNTKTDQPAEHPEHPE